MNSLLIIDDEPAVARLIKKVAESCGYTAQATNTSEDFTDALIAREPDVIVLDLSLPDVDGVELLRFLSLTKCRAKILIISGFDPRVLETTANLGGELGLYIAGTLAKPVRVANLREAFAGLDKIAA